VIRKLTLVTAFGAGYVLGAKAGTQRYEQIVGKFRELAGMPAVQEVTHTLADTAGQLGDKAKATVTEKVAAVGDKITGNDVVDLAGSNGGSNKGRTGARTAAAPRPGAAPSATAPDA
jgi:tryptophan synthase beta subunit